jgi:hypothetical protein
MNRNTRLLTAHTPNGAIDVELASGTTDTLVLRSPRGEAYEQIAPEQRAECLEANGIDPAVVEARLAAIAYDRKLERAKLISAREALSEAMMGRSIDHSIEVGGPLSGTWLRLELSPEGAERLAAFIRGSK